MTTLVYTLRGLFGLAVLVGIAYACSSNRRLVSWRLVGMGILLQLVFALIVLRTGPGRALFEFVGRVFSRVLGFTFEGSRFIFGPLGIPQGQEGSLGPIFAFQVLPTIIFFGALMGMLYYLGLVQPVVRGIGAIMSKTLKISGAESLATAANVFIGQSEAPLVIRPYIQSMTRSELMTLMTGGMATIAGGVMAAYILFLGGDDPAAQALFAGHLLSASIMSAPAAIVMAKIMVPETETPLTMGRVEMLVPVQGSNVLEATADGAAEGLKLALNVAAMLLAFIALLAMVNFLLAVIGRPVLFGWEAYDLNAVISSWTNGRFTSLSLQSIFAFIFAPIAWAMGVDSSEIMLFGSLLGEKIAVNEFIAYLSLSNLKDVLSERTTIIAAYALCGFANFASIAIQIGGIGGIAPERRSDVAKLGIQAVIGGALASWMTATIAGMLLR